MKIMGYQRENGAFGVRNYVAVIPSVFCADHAAQRIADQVKSAVAMPHPVGCGQHGEDLDQNRAHPDRPGPRPQCGRGTSGGSGL